jgi:parvulin-like peptidyl-prolyl isomerase
LISLVNAGMMLRNVAWAALVGIAVAACSDLSEDGPGSASRLYQFGPTISDPAIATLVISGERTDTLGSDQFNANLHRLNSMFPDVMADPDQEASIRREIVKQFVVEQLVMAEAERVGVEVSAQDIDVRLAAYRNSFSSDEEFRTESERFGRSETDLVEQFHVELTRTAVSDMVEARTPQPATSEVDEYRTSLAEKLLAQHILFMVGETITADDRDELTTKALAVLDSVRSGVNFGDLARRHSDDVGTAQVGGELPWFRRGQMVEGFEKAAFVLEAPGDVTDHLVETTYGYHIIRLIDRSTDDLISVDSARSLLWRQHVRKAERDHLDKLHEGAEIRVNPDLVPAFPE